MSQPLTHSVVVPVYNSEGSLAELVRQVREALAPISVRYEIILVNDGSRDGSWCVIQDLAREFPEVRGLHMMRNYGQHNALLCGIRAARHEVVITLDDDLQHPPAEIPRLLSALTPDYDVVYGVPEEMPHSLFRNLLSRGTKGALARAMGLSNVRDVSAFRVFRTELRRAFASFQSPNLVLDVLLSWGTSRFGSLKVRHEPRRFGKSGYTFGKLFNQFMFLLTGFSTAPLRLASIIGFVFTLLGLLVFVYVTVQYFVVGSVPGFPFLASLISLFSGAQLFALGIIGEYLARMFHRSMERPTYVLSSEIGAPAEQGPLETGREETGARP
jgi:glycosyltransferase involved in cell wall biosynthesis